jgi:hypothetical protein
MLTSSVVILHGNARPRTAVPTRTQQEHFNWELFAHPPHIPDLAPSDCHLFVYLKNWLWSQHFNNNEESMERSSQAANVFDTGIQKLTP